MAAKKIMFRLGEHSEHGPGFEEDNGSMFSRLYDDDAGFRALAAGQITEDEYARDCLMVWFAKKKFWRRVQPRYRTD